MLTLKLHFKKSNSQDFGWSNQTKPAKHFMSYIDVAKPQSRAPGPGCSNSIKLTQDKQKLFWYESCKFAVRFSGLCPGVLVHGGNNHYTPFFMNLCLAAEHCRVFCIGSCELVHEDRTIFCLYCLALSFEFEWCNTAQNISSERHFFPRIIHTSVNV